MHIFALLALLAGSPLAAPAVTAHEADNLPTCAYLCDEDGATLTTTGDKPPGTELVTRIFLGTFGELCGWAIAGGPGLYAPEVYELSYRPTWLEPGDSDRPLHLYRFFCSAGAYNEAHVYLIWTAEDGVQPVSFAQPRITYEQAAEGDDTEIVGLAMTGMTTKARLVNSVFDGATGTVTEWSCWRGLCDASSRGEWRLVDGAFSLVSYDVDPAYDGEVKLFRVVDYSEATPVEMTDPLPHTLPVPEEG